MSTGGQAQPEPAAGMLLLATPELLDPNFAETVVLLLDVNDDGVLGVVLNRPSGLPVGQVLSAWSDVVAEPEVLFRGGPVEVDGALAVGARRDGASPAGFAELPGLPGPLGLLDLDTPVELAEAGLDRLRIFAGYAGWGAEQLQAEIDEGHWYVVPGAPADVFRTEVAGLWRDVLRRQPGDLALHATRPADPDLN